MNDLVNKDRFSLMSIDAHLDRRLRRFRRRASSSLEATVASGELPRHLTPPTWPAAGDGDVIQCIHFSYQRSTHSTRHCMSQRHCLCIFPKTALDPNPTFRRATRGEFARLRSKPSQPSKTKISRLSVLKIRIIFVGGSTNSE